MTGAELIAAERLPFALAPKCCPHCVDSTDCSNAFICKVIDDVREKSEIDRLQRLETPDE